MRLTLFSDYAIRILILSCQSQGELLTIEKVSQHYSLSRSHVMKIVHLLIKKGFLKSVRGRRGGFLLAYSPEKINIGDVLRATEPDFCLVECFDNKEKCSAFSMCYLPFYLKEGLQAFFMVLDSYTLQDLVKISGKELKIDSLKQASLIR